MYQPNLREGVEMIRNRDHSLSNKLPRPEFSARKLAIRKCDLIALWDKEATSDMSLGFMGGYLVVIVTN